MKHVFSMETEREKDLQTLAETIVNCQLRRKANACSDIDCGRCSTYEELARCMNELPACDSLRVRNMVQELYGYKEFQYGLDRRRAVDVAVDVARAVAVGAGMAAASIGWALLIAVPVIIALAIMAR